MDEDTWTVKYTEMRAAERRAQHLAEIHQTLKRLAAEAAHLDVESLVAQLRPAVAEASRLATLAQGFASDLYTALEQARGVNEEHADK